MDDQGILLLVLLLLVLVLLVLLVLLLLLLVLVINARINHNSDVLTELELLLDSSFRIEGFRVVAFPWFWSIVAFLVAMTDRLGFVAARVFSKLK